MKDASTPKLLSRIEQDWRIARPDLDPEPMLTVIAVQRTSGQLQAELEAFFAGHDLTPSAFDVLATLRRSAPPEGLTLGELSALMAITPPAVTKRVDALSARQLIERLPDTSDRRAIRARLTATGRTLIDSLLPQHLANEERLLAALSVTERRTLRALLGRIGVK
ncbi:MarR family winged helix-turn-helix transcriptional regulator [Deinococcus humi]|uniref:DNA-binding MarR family transcriptional regulator n=1 Tax=Deinococcus humi TaxID=662880 RepID=A0A7W8JS17_9DEIO|nr:MarR family transcriptional regulator [Deinococcus humi]MBB5362172.1 DNA-binding MarR family transcriptional regulator [Deinococcus humi]GGO21730.1 MarR family transcriptional regulator [Deinococcus humi]